MDTNLHRRRYLQLVAAGSAVGLAGCTEEISGTTGGNGNGNGNGNGAGGIGASGGVPDYANWLGTGSDSSLFFVRMDWAELQEGNSDDGDDDDSSSDLADEYKQDPMFGLPFGGMFIALLAAGFGLAGYGLSELAKPNNSLATSIDDAIIVDGGMALPGSVDVTEITDILTKEKETGFGTQYEQTGSYGSFELYTAVDGADMAAVSDAALVISGEGEDDKDPQAVIERLIDTYNGDSQRATDELDDFGWMLSAAGSGSVAIGAYGDGTEELQEDDDSSGSQGSSSSIGYNGSELDEADGFVSSMTFADDESADGEFAALVPESAQGPLESVLGASGSNTDIQTNGNRIYASTSWSSLENATQ